MTEPHGSTKRDPGESRGIPASVAAVLPAGPGRPEVTYRIAGDDYLLVEYGDMVLDLNLTFRVLALRQALTRLSIGSILELAPGVRSLLVRYEHQELPLDHLLKVLQDTESVTGSVDELVIPSRVVRLPIAFDDSSTREAIARYMQSVRATGPYLPSNLEFVARCNGLTRVEQVKECLLGTEHLVIGLGDVYLGAPCAIPLDPRKRLVVPKYNPARTWTAAGIVGIGGAFICIYAVDSPGGYQLVGRSLPMWNTWQTTAAFKDTPWLLRPFDRIQFEPVTEEQLAEAREAIITGGYSPEIKPDAFSVASYNAFLASIEAEAATFRSRQQAASVEAMVGY